MGTNIKSKKLLNPYYFYLFICILLGILIRVYPLTTLKMLNYVAPIFSKPEMEEIEKYSKMPYPSAVNFSFSEILL